MDFNKIFKRVAAILTKPNDEWGVIKNEQMSIADIFTKYAMILAAIPAIAGFIGYSLIGISVGFGTIRVPAGRTLVWAILLYIFTLGVAFLLGFIIDSLAPSFGAKKDLTDSLKIVVFSFTALWVAGILYIIPTLRVVVFILSLYTLFLLYTGLKKLKEAPKDKMPGFLVVSIIITIVLYILVGFIVSSIAFGSARGFFW